jgi:hypothetical protein
MPKTLLPTTHYSSTWTSIHPQKWDFWTHRRRSAEKVPTMGKATLHTADRQPCGYKSIHQQGAIACPWYYSLRNRVGYFRGTGEILGLGFGSFFFVSLLCVTTFWLHNLVFKWPFLTKIKWWLHHHLLHHIHIFTPRKSETTCYPLSLLSNLIRT